MDGKDKGISNVRVSGFTPLSAPEDVRAEVTVSESARKTVLAGRQSLRAALTNEDRRFVVIVGPCSIHDPKSALEYAEKLMKLREQVKEHLLVVMRVYFEKPRTTVGWKGLINDPHLDGSHDIERGLRLARQVLLGINEIGMPCATEFLDPIVPQYTSDLVSWAAIGARTTESQTHRQMASGLSMPVGFKNATDGSIQVALDAMVAAKEPHAFVGIDMSGRTAVVQTRGNEDVHLILRGGGGLANCSRAHVAYTKVLLETHGKQRLIMVDCSHGNSMKDYRLQPKVFDETLQQVLGGEDSLLGVMLESNLVEGNQKLGPNLTYGKSITDGCIGIDATEALLLGACDRLAKSSRSISS